MHLAQCWRRLRKACHSWMSSSEEQVGNSSGMAQEERPSIIEKSIWKWSLFVAKFTSQEVSVTKKQKWVWPGPGPWEAENSYHLDPFFFSLVDDQTASNWETTSLLQALKTINPKVQAKNILGMYQKLGHGWDRGMLADCPVIQQTAALPSLEGIGRRGLNQSLRSPLSTWVVLHKYSENY